jgi:hypothetical protein
MALTDEQFRLILDLSQSSKNVDELTQKIAQLGVTTERAAKLAEQAWNSEQAAAQRAAAATAEASQEVQQMATRLGTSGDFGRALLQGSYAVQDFTSQLGTRGLAGAIGAIQNNIPLLLTNLGLSGGLAGVISIVSIGLAALIPQFQKAFGGETQEEIEKTKKKLEEFDVQVKKLDESLKKLKEAPAEAEKEEAANVKAILEARPTAARLQAELERQAYKEDIAKFMPPEKIAEFQKIIAAPGGMFPGGPEYAAALQRARDARKGMADLEQQARRAVAAQTLEQAQIAGPAGAAARRRLMGVAPEDIRRELESATVEGQRKSDEADEAFNEQIAQRRNAVQRRNKWNKDAEDLTERGRENERIMRAGQEKEADREQRDREREERQAAQQARRVAMFNLQKESQQLERGYQNELYQANFMDNVADRIREINWRHMVLKRQLEDKGMALREEAVGAPGN